MNELPENNSLSAWDRKNASTKVRRKTKNTFTPYHEFSIARRGWGFGVDWGEYVEYYDKERGRWVKAKE